MGHTGTSGGNRNYAQREWSQHYRTESRRIYPCVHALQVSYKNGKRNGTRRTRDMGTEERAVYTQNARGL